MNNISYKTIAVAVSCTAGAIILALLVLLVQMHQKMQKNVSRDLGTQYPLTSPILDFELLREGDGLAVSVQDATAATEHIKEDRHLEYVSVYFRDLFEGQWIGIGGDDMFAPASLLKLPLYMAFLRYAQDTPSILTKRVTITMADVKSVLPQDSAALGTRLKIGESYTVDEIARHMIQQSDNAAITTLYRVTPERYLQDIYSSTGIVLNISDGDAEIKVKDYATFFRLLFNSSYLNREMSEQALELLSGATFTGGLVAGVPPSVTVAHKFGERQINHGSDDAPIEKKSTQLHDCGIIYYPKKPYILCVMTRGGETADEQAAIADISRFFYNKIDQQNSS